MNAARTWVDGFVTWYNTEHRHSAIRFVTPEQRHGGEDRAILAQRKMLYQRAQMENPRVGVAILETGTGLPKSV